MITTALALIFPVLFGGVLHMVVVRLDLLAGLKIPLWQKGLGPNKTWRGVVAVPPLTALGVLLVPGGPFEGLDVNERLLGGMVLGLAYVVFELPNSFLKRRLGIAPGKRAQRHGWFFSLLDQTDSALGCVLVYGLWLPVGMGPLLICLLLGPGIHALVNLALWGMGLRKEPL